MAERETGQKPLPLRQCLAAARWTDGETDDLLGTIGVRPFEWTGSGYGFDREPGVLILELLRAEIAECGMQPALIVEVIDEVR